MRWAGGGRTGKLWAIEHSGVEPDMLVWAKAVGGDVPLSGLTVHNRYHDKLPPSSQVITSAENALANVVALANLEILTDPDADLLGRSLVIGDEVKQRLKEAAAESKIIDEVRGRGFFIGIELVSDKDTRQPLDTKHVRLIAGRCEQRGVRVMSCGRYGSTIRLMPPLIITRDHLRKAVDVLVDVIRESENEILP